MIDGNNKPRFILWSGVFIYGKHPNL